MNDAEFLDYCYWHSKTERAGFVGEHVARILRLAGQDEERPSNSTALRGSSAFLMTSCARLSKKLAQGLPTHDTQKKAFSWRGSDGRSYSTTDPSVLWELHVHGHLTKAAYRAAFKIIRPDAQDVYEPSHPDEHPAQHAGTAGLECTAMTKESQRKAAEKAQALRFECKTWGSIYWHHKRKGRDPSDAASRADQWEKRQRRDRWKNCPSTHCERREQCASPNECSASRPSKERE